MRQIFLTPFQNDFYLNIIINIEVACCLQYNYLCRINFEIPNKQLSGIKQSLVIIRFRDNSKSLANYLKKKPKKTKKKKKKKLSSKVLASSLIPNIFWQSSGKLPDAGKVLCQSIAICSNDRQSLPAQFFFAATMPLPCSDIMAQILFNKGCQWHGVFQMSA